MGYPHPRGKASRGEIGCFMFFAWPVLLATGAISLFFELVGWLLEQAWFYVLLAGSVLALIIASCASNI